MLVELKISLSWPKNKYEAVNIQKELAGRVDLVSNNKEPSTIAAIDTAYGFGGEKLYAAVVVVSFPGFREIERTYYVDAINFPYYPGLFFFREGPVIIEALKKIKSQPDLLIVHGHGIAHPRHIGLACHLGLCFEIPTVGCARKLLAGNHRPVAENKGNSQPILLHGKEVGCAYRSKARVKPIFISPGHKCDLPFARDIIVKCLRDYRLPEPLRLAHLFANKFKRFNEKDLKKTDSELSLET